MKIVIKNFHREHYNLLLELAKVLKFKITGVEMSEDEYLLAAMEEVKDEPIATKKDKEEFEVWLRAATK